MESQTELMESHQVDNEWQGSGENWRDEVIRLKQALANKEEVVSRSIKKWRIGTLYRMEALKQLRFQRAKLDSFNQRFATLKESHLKQLQEEQEKYCKVFKLAEKSKKQLWEQERRFKEELREKNEQLKLQLALNEETFQKKMCHELAMVHQKHVELQEAMKLQFADKEKSLKTTMAERHQQWEVREQQWLQQKQRLEEMLEEREMSRQWLVLTSKMEIQRLQRKILKLRVSGRPKVPADLSCSGGKPPKIRSFFSGSQEEQLVDGLLQTAELLVQKAAVVTERDEEEQQAMVNHGSAPEAQPWESPVSSPHPRQGRKIPQQGFNTGRGNSRTTISDCRHSKNPKGGNPPQPESKTRVVRVRENAVEFVGKANFKHESDCEVGK